MSIEKVLYRAHATATGGRDGRAVASDGALDVKLTTPRELGGAGGAGTNPEQLFAAGYSACFIGALKFVRRTAFEPSASDAQISDAPERVEWKLGRLRDHHCEFAIGCPGPNHPTPLALRHRQRQYGEF